MTFSEYRRQIVSSPYLNRPGSLPERGNADLPRFTSSPAGPGGKFAAAGAVGPMGSRAPATRFTFVDSEPAQGRARRRHLPGRSVAVARAGRRLRSLFLRVDAWCAHEAITAAPRRDGTRPGPPSPSQQRTHRRGGRRLGPQRRRPAECSRCTAPRSGTTGRAGPSTRSRAPNEARRQSLSTASDCWTGRRRWVWSVPACRSSIPRRERRVRAARRGHACRRGAPPSASASRSSCST